jgi:predicted amidohydrolase
VNVPSHPEGSARPRLAVVQTRPVLGDVDANVAAAEAELQALAGHADLAVLPELFTTGYALNGFDHRRLAEPLDRGPTIGRLCRAAAASGVAICGGVLEASGDAVYDTAVVIDRSGQLVGRYRKTHLHPTERATFAPGDELVVVPLDGSVTLGAAICFEHGFPEVFAELALAGANVVAIPSAVPVRFEYLLELRTRARAQDNQVFVAAANLAGDDGRTQWCGGSAIVDPRGTVVAGPAGREPARLVAELDLAIIDAERRQEPVLRDRRPELYRRLGPRDAGSVQHT